MTEKVESAKPLQSTAETTE